MVEHDVAIALGEHRDRIAKLEWRADQTDKTLSKSEACLDQINLKLDQITLSLAAGQGGMKVAHAVVMGLVGLVSAAIGALWGHH